MTELRGGNLGIYELQGKVAVITGGSNGIGAATARRLAAAGAKVVVGYNEGAARAESLAAELPGSGHLALRMPMADSAALKAAAEVTAKLGRCDVLVNSAGTTRAVPHADLEALDDDLIDRVLTINVRGPIATIRAFLPLLKASGDAVIVNISSLAAVTGTGSSIIYGASKAAVDTIGLSLARVLGSSGIRVVSVSPSAVLTDFVPGRSRETVEKAALSSPLRTLTEADDVAVAVMSVVTHLRLTTGVSILVDGGKHL